MKGCLFKRPKRGTKAWRRAPWQMRYQDARGRMVWRSTGTTVLERAQDKLTEAVAAAGRGEADPSGRELFGTVAEAWLERNKVKRSHIDNASRYRTWLREPFGALRLRDIRPEMVEALARTMLERGKSPATVRRVLALARKILSDAVRDGLLGESPFRRVLPENLPLALTVTEADPFRVIP
jgi:hypothetical protein